MLALVDAVRAGAVPFRRDQPGQVVVGEGGTVQVPAHVEPGPGQQVEHPLAGRPGAARGRLGDPLPGQLRGAGRHAAQVDVAQERVGELVLREQRRALAGVGEGGQRLLRAAGQQAGGEEQRRQDRAGPAVGVHIEGDGDARGVRRPDGRLDVGWRAPQMAGMDADAGGAPDRHQFVQARTDVAAVGTQMRDVRASRPGQRAGHVRDLPGTAEPAGQVVQPAGQADRPVRERVLDLAPRGGPFAGAERAGRHPGNVVADRSLGGEDGDVLRQPAGHGLPVAGQAEAARGFQRAIDRREVPVQVPGGGRGGADPRLPVLADHQGGHPLREGPVHPPGGEQRALGVNVGIDESRADHAARGQVDQLAVGGPAQRTDRGDEPPVDQDVGGRRRGADPVGHQAAAQQRPCGQHRPPSSQKIYPAVSRMVAPERLVGKVAHGRGCADD
jgi:hypothetical protein